MYSTNLDLITQARLRETQNVALSQKKVKHHFPKWIRRAAGKTVSGAEQAAHLALHRLHLA